MERLISTRHFVTCRITAQARADDSLFLNLCSVLLIGGFVGLALILR